MTVGQMLANGGLVVPATSNQMMKEQEKGNRTSSAFMKQHKVPPAQFGDSSPTKQLSKVGYQGSSLA